jgi:hypothetical protein
MAAALTLLTASLIHFGVRLPLAVTTVHDPDAGAAVPEAVIAIVLAGGAAVVLTSRRARWSIALATALFALLGVCVGLRFTLISARTGDIFYHLTLLASLLTLVTLLFSSDGRAALHDR